MIKKLIVPLIIAALVLAVLLLILVVFRKEPAGVAGSGMIEVLEVKVSSRTSGQIRDLAVKEGDRVQEGDTIAVIDHRELLAQEKEAVAGLTVAEQSLREIRLKKTDQERNVERIRTLHESGDVPDKEYEAVQTQLQVLDAQESKAEAGLSAARARRELIQTQIANAYLVAPISGVILALNYEKGETVSPGAVIAKIGDLATATLKIFIPEQDIGGLSLGREARVIVDAYPGEAFAGKVTWIASESEFTPRNIQTRDERAQLVFAIKITIPNGSQKLLPGMPADAWIVDHGDSRR